MDENFADPFHDAYGEVSRRVVELGSIVATVGQLWANHRRLRQAERAAEDERQARYLRAQRLAAMAEAQAGWAPAHDPRWLRRAGLLDTARVWGAAVPYGHDVQESVEHAQRVTEWARQQSRLGPEAAAHAQVVLGEVREGLRLAQSAAVAMDKTEKRLRELHPHGMAHYDRLRQLGLGAAEAMWHAVPFFARDPNVHDARPAPDRAVLEAGAADGRVRPGMEHGPTREGWEIALMEARARGIVTDLQSRAAAMGRDELGADELRTVLEQLTNLPEGIIDNVVEENELRGRTTRAGSVDAEGPLADAAERARAGALDISDSPQTVRADEHTEALGDASRAAGTADAARARNAAGLAADFHPHTAHEVVAHAARNRTESAAPARTVESTTPVANQRHRLN